MANSRILHLVSTSGSVKHSETILYFLTVIGQRLAAMNLLSPLAVSDEFSTIRLQHNRAFTELLHAANSSLYSQVTGKVPGIPNRWKQQRLFLLAVTDITNNISFHSACSFCMLQGQQCSSINTLIPAVR